MQILKDGNAAFVAADDFVNLQESPVLWIKGLGAGDRAALQEIRARDREAAALVFNADPLPPQEYRMRRSYNPLDEFIPGAVVRERKCPNCERQQMNHGFANACGKCFAHTKVYSVDVPLVPKGGSQ